MGRERAVEAGGWLMLAFGVVHTALATWGTRAEWSRVHAEGWWDTARVRPRNGAELTRAHVLWMTAGSFGGPCAALGALTVSSARAGRPVSRWVGGTLLAWSVPLVVVLPRSPSWLAPVFAGLLLLGGRRE
jgi:hypothetical protein